jgi:putative ABC transport system permease protein
MKALGFSLLTLKRDWCAGELRLMVMALILAVGAVTAVSFFTDRVRQAMAIQGGAMLAADLVVDSINPIPASLLAKAQALDLKTAHTVLLHSMVIRGEQLQLAEVKAVSSAYPLRGRLAIGEGPFDPPRETEQIPAAGTVWLDASMLQALKLSPGQPITLGTAEFTVAKVLLFEPDRGGDLFHIAPRLMMNLEDLPATGLLSPGSRVRHRLLLAGSRDAIETYRQWVNQHFQEKLQLISVREARPELRAALDHGDKFLGLAALSSVLLAGVAIATAARRFATRHLDHCAIMRCLGATQGFIVRVYALTMLWLGLITCLLGCLMGLIAQQVLAGLLAGLIVGDLPAPSLLPVVTGTLTGLIALLGFALPPLIQLKNVSPARVLRRDLGNDHTPAAAIYISAIVAIALLVSWHAGEVRLTLYVLGGSVATVGILAIAAWILVNSLSFLRSRVGVAWRYGFANVARRAQSSIVQTVALGLGIMALLLLSLVRADLLKSWQAKLPEEAPNHFVINIQPEEVAAIREFFKAKGINPTGLYPIVHGRLVAINEEPVDPAHYEEPRAQRLARREFHLTWMTRLQADNRIVAGRWWPPETTDSDQFSIENDIAEILGIALYDTLSFQVLDQKVAAKVTSIRTVDWNTFNPNFFVIAPPGLLDRYPATYITSFFLGEQQKSILIELSRSFPSITVLDVTALMQQLRTIMDRVAWAVEFIFGFTLAAGLLVLFAATQATHDERLHDSAVLRTLGASRSTLIRGLAAEFLSLGIVAGLLAAVGATAIGYVLASQVFTIDFQFNPWLFGLGLGVGGIGIGIAGLVGTWPVLRLPPVHILRRFW